MKISVRSITALVGLITGDKKISPYKSGPMLVRLFNEYGFDDEYGQGFPSRNKYADEKVRELNGKRELVSLVCEILDPRAFMDTDFPLNCAVDYLNARLRFDGYEVIVQDDQSLPKIRSLKGSAVELSHSFEGSAQEAHFFIDEQIKKAENKIRDGDYDGAITNARTLLESYLREIEKKIFNSPQDYDGDLPGLFKRLQKELALDPSRPDIDTPIKQVLSGLASVVSGIAGLSNKMGDRHVRKYKPDKRHAVLTVNAAKTLANFIFDTFQYKYHSITN